MIVSLLRHGSTEWNEAGRMQGRSDVPLSARGRTQVRAWRVPVDPEWPAQWISSPLRRAVETAEILSGAAPHRESALTEMDWGEWEGFGLGELRDRFADEFTRNEAAGLDFRPPGGESPRDVQHRMQCWLRVIAAQDRPVIAVTHKGVLRAVLATAIGWDMTGKPPIRLQDDAMHRFAVDRNGAVSLVECNVPLVTLESNRRPKI